RVDAPVAAPKNVLSTNLGLRWNWGEGGDGSFAGFGMSASVIISYYGIWDYANEEDEGSWDVSSQDKSKLYLKSKNQVAENKIKKFLEKHKWEELRKYSWYGSLPVYNGMISLVAIEEVYDSEYRFLGSNLKGTLNLDIRTGEEFDLRAVFADNVNAEKELNKYLSLYALSAYEEQIYKFKGIDMETPFYIDFDEKYLVLFPNEKTPLLSGAEIKIPFESLENVLAIFERFPPLKKDEFDLTAWKKDATANIEAEAKERLGYGTWNEEGLELWKQRMLESLKEVSFADIFRTREYSISKELYTKKEMQEWNGGMP
ncbi:MAG: hypothetical protein FWE47_03715, partial [Oscillospiraceae bacterium]|nr:hypothetical protein [Oscillospiraceae bacterium]